MTKFASALESADELSLDEQEELAAMLLRRIAERRRAELVAAVIEARAEFGEGRIEAKSPADIVNMFRL